MTGYPAKYDDLIDAETWAFIERTNSFYPPDAVGLSIGEQRAVYNRMCAAFHVGRPDGVRVEDSRIAGSDHTVPVRTYVREGGAGATLGYVVYFHGGGFVVGGLDSHDDVCAEICGRTGLVVVSVDYRLAPEHRFPDDVEDAMTVFSHVETEAGERPVIVAGDSAGGNLAASICHSTRDGRGPDGQLLIYPGLGSTFEQGSFLEHAEAPMLTTTDIEFYKTIRTRGDPVPLADPRCCPLNDSDFSGLPPTVIFAAQCDPLVDDSDDYARRIVSGGGKAVCHVEAGLVHGYLRARHSVARARRSFDRIVDTIGKMAAGDSAYS